jgi:hypothetical protein
MTWDPADDASARANRAGKVEVLTAWCQARGLGPGTVAGWDEVTRRRAARAARVNPPRATSPTWGMVIDQLAEPTALADDARDEHQQWCTGCDAPALHPGRPKPPAPELDSPAANATHPALPGSLPAAPDFGSTPKGWSALVALGPVTPPRPCTVPGPAGSCGAPAVIRMMGGGGADVWRCASHPPAGDEWGHGLDFSPADCLHPIRCYCGRCHLDPR